MLQHDPIIKSSGVQLGCADAARAYVKSGWAIVPNHTPNPARRGRPGECSCMPYGRCRIGHPGKHPRTQHGFSDATRDLRQIERWWTQFPQANIGVQPRKSNLATVDIDARNGGNRSLTALTKQFGELPPTPTVRRKTVGLVHFYFALPCCDVGDMVLAPGVDLIINRQIICPPSFHIDGAQYEWVNTPWDIPLAALPDWIIDAAASKIPLISDKSPNTFGYTVKREVKRSFYCVPDVLDVHELLRDPEIVAACIPHLGIPVDIEIGQLFHCVLPGHDEQNPSARIFQYDDGKHGYADFHLKPDSRTHYPLGAVRGMLAYKQVRAFKKPELLTWTLRLFVEAGVLQPVDVAMPILPDPLPSGMPNAIPAVYGGFRLLLACKWLYKHGDPTAFARKFAAVWCGVGERQAYEAIRWMIRYGYIRISNQTSNQWFFMPGQKTQLKLNRGGFNG